MEDKTFELLTKLYGELTEFRKETNTRLGSLEEGQKGLSNDIIRLENDHGKKLDALFDGYRQTYEKLEDIEDKFDTLSEKADNHEIRLQVLEDVAR